MKHTLLALLAVGLLGSGASAAPDKTYYGEVKTTQTLDGKPQTTLTKVWIKSATKFRLEQAAQGQTLAVINNDADTWQINTTQKKGIHAKQSPQSIAMMNRQGRLFGNDLDQFLKAGAKKNGQEAIDGMACDKYTQKAPNGLLVTLWVLPGPEKLTRRKQMTGTVQAPAAPGAPPQSHAVNRVIDFHWQIGKPMDEALFRPPAGITITEAPTPTAPPAPGGK